MVIMNNEQEISYVEVFFTRLRRKPWPPGRGGIRMSSEALAKEDWSFGGLRRTAFATGSCPWGFTSKFNILVFLSVILNSGSCLPWHAVAC
jgi:hypothetical protein